MPLPEKSLIGRYEIRSQLGAGGMGEVYLAYDTQLHRLVALKILPAHLASDVQRMRRFTQEARSASSLSHPNIIAIYEIGQADSVHFIATELVDGVTIRHLMARSRMTLRDVFDIAIQVASALASAHEAGIIHRDIKPENVMLRHDGYVKVLDFGLAKLTEKVQAGKASDPEAETVSVINTDPGVVMGTVQYMSPEQARGLAVDARTDIWSLGCILYEMITGRLPFKGATSSDVIACILEREPASLVSYAPDIPKELERIVTKSLEKDVEERYQTVKDLLIDIRRLKKQLELEEALERSVKQPDDDEGQKPTDNRKGARDTHKDSSTGKREETQISSAEYIIGEIKNHKRAVILAVLLLMIVGGWFVYQFFSRKPVIAVLPFSYKVDLNQTDGPVMEDLSQGITKRLMDDLAQLSSTVSVKQRSTVYRYKGPEVDPQKAGRELGAQWVLTGIVSKRGNTLIVQAELNDVDTESQVWGEVYKREQPEGAESTALQEEFSRQIIDNVRAKLSDNR
ncbi:MAG TPA: protein kinase [Pyrinomonadaceae bacterium]|nr:protein kinase [Pyrinomonadaceae bacterium]